MELWSRKSPPTGHNHKNQAFVTYDNKLESKKVKWRAPTSVNLWPLSRINLVWNPMHTTTPFLLPESSHRWSWYLASATSSVFQWIVASSRLHQNQESLHTTRRSAPVPSRQGLPGYPSLIFLSPSLPHSLSSCLPLLPFLHIEKLGKRKKEITNHQAQWCRPESEACSEPPLL